jgi:hypothetical protein
MSSSLKNKDIQRKKSLFFSVFFCNSTDISRLFYQLLNKSINDFHKKIFFFLTLSLYLFIQNDSSKQKLQKISQN